MVELLVFVVALFGATIGSIIGYIAGNFFFRYWFLGIPWKRPDYFKDFYKKHGHFDG